MTSPHPPAPASGPAGPDEPPADTSGDTSTGTSAPTSGVGELSRRAALNTAVRSVAEILGKVATLAWTVAAARTLSTEDFGAVSYALTLMLLLSSVAAWGFDSGLVRRSAAEPDSLPRLYRATQVEKTGLGLVVFSVASLVAVQSRADTGTWVVIVLMVLAGFPEMWSQSARGAAAVRQSAAAVSSALVVQRLVTAVVIVAALALGLGPVGVASGFLVGTLAGWGAHVLAVRRLDLHTRTRELTREDLAAAASGTFLLGVSSLVLMLLFRLDAVLLAALKGDEAVAVYSVAYRLLETVLFVAHAINQAVLPVLSSTSSTLRRRNAFERGVAVAGFVYLPFAVVCVVEGERVLRLLFGAPYGEAAAPVLAWLAPAPMLFAIAFFGNSLMLAQQRNRLLLASSVLALAVNTGLNLALIPAYSGVGAAIATSVAYLAQSLLVVYVVRDLEDRPRLLQPLTSAVLGGVVLLGVLLALDLPVVVELALGGVVYLAAWALASRRLAPDQYAMVAGVARRVARR